MRIAIFRDFEHDHEMVRDESCERYTDMVRITEYVDVQFTRRPASDYAPELGKQKRAKAERLRAALEKVSIELAKVENS